jgi:uncharacterized cupin superfamily protein
VVPESRLEPTEHGLVPAEPGWYVLNARDASWWQRDRRGFYCELEGGADFTQLGMNITVLGPGEPMGMYHWEADQEDFLVVAGEAVLVVEGQERPLRQWDFVHCPPGTNHVIVGAGTTPCVVVAVGARIDSVGPNWGRYTVDEAAGRHGASVDEETDQPEQAYARFAPGVRTRYPDGALPEQPQP